MSSQMMKCETKMVPLVDRYNPYERTSSVNTETYFLERELDAEI